MNFKPTLSLIIFLIFTSCSENSSNEEDKKNDEPEVTERYYFEGKIDGEPFLIEKKVFNNLGDDFTDDDPFSVDYGGTLINCSNEPLEGIHSDCYTIYASGIIIYNNAYPEEVDKHNTAKMYFGRIDVDKRTFDDELTELRNFFKKNEFGFRRDFGSTKVPGDFAFDFFPPNSDKDKFYYSTRFNDNSEYTVNIKLVEEIDNHFFIIEGAIDNCKLYDLRDNRDANQTSKMLTDFKFRTKIQIDFNYNNYKD